MIARYAQIHSTSHDDQKGRSSMIRHWFIFVVVLTSCLMGEWCWATKAYVTDSLKINLYNGPNIRDKVIAVVPSGESVEVFLSQDEWSFIRLLERGQNNKDGFILSKYLTTRPSVEKEARRLKGENAGLKEKLAQTEKKLSEAVRLEQNVNAKLQEDTKALHTLKGEYELLRQEAAEYLKLKKAYEKTLSEIENVREHTQKLTEENEKLESSQRKKFITLEIVILISGFVIGLAIGRAEKKGRSLYY